MAAPTDYLKLRGRKWFVYVQIPAHLREVAGGKWAYIKTLKTGDVNEANRRKHPYVAAYKQRITALERQHKTSEQPSALAEIYDRALSLREAIERGKGEVRYIERDGTPYTDADEFISQISEEAEELLQTHGPKAADAFYKIARGEGTPLRSQIDPWLTEQTDHVTGQTISQHRAVLKALLAWAGDGLSIEDVSRKRAGEYVGHLLAPTSGLSRQTAKRHVSSLSSLWTWLEARGLAEGNPWLQQGVSKKAKRGGSTENTTKRGQWSDGALVRLLRGSYTPRYTETLHDLIKLALVTGARLDELCALKPEHVQKQKDGWWITISAGKTEAAVRDIPTHESVTHVLERRLKHARSFLFDSLIPGGPDKKRSWNVSKAFGHFTRRLDLGETRRTFHELRNTFIEALEAAEVPESTTKLIVGHARASMTYGHYSKGQRVQLREAINKLRYSAEVMRLIRTPTREDKAPTTTDKKRDQHKSKKHRYRQTP